MRKARKLASEKATLEEKYRNVSIERNALQITCQALRRNHDAILESYRIKQAQIVQAVADGSKNMADAALIVEDFHEQAQKNADTFADEATKRIKELLEKR